MPDLDILAALAELAEKHAPQLRPYQPIALVHQFRRTLLRELDFTSERRNIEEFAAHFEGDGAVHFPRTYPALSSRRVLTMERLDGILGTDTAALKTSGADTDEFARRGANMYLEMIFRDAFYHADPHPGNLMLLPGGVVGVLDCGMVWTAGAGVGGTDRRHADGHGQPGSGDLAEMLMRVGSAPPGAPRNEFRADVADFVADYTNQSIHELDLSSALRTWRTLSTATTLPCPRSYPCCCGRWWNWRGRPRS